MNCQDQIYSEEYIDFIGNRSLIESKYTLDCKQPLGARFASLYLKLSDGYEDGTVYGYYNIPKLFAGYRKYGIIWYFAGKGKSRS